jgi:hypothetical protein
MRKQEAADQVKKLETELATRHAAELLSLTKVLLELIVVRFFSCSL